MQQNATFMNTETDNTDNALAALYRKEMELEGELATIREKIRKLQRPEQQSEKAKYRGFPGHRSREKNYNWRP